MSDFRLSWIALALLPLVGGCGDDEPSGPATSFSATLTGAEEVPAVPTTATGPPRWTSAAPRSPTPST